MPLLLFDVVEGRSDKEVKDLLDTTHEVFAEGVAQYTTGELGAKASNITLNS